jgi:hypothetical protein
MKNKTFFLLTISILLLSLKQTDEHYSFKATKILYCSSGKCDDKAKKSEFNFKFYPEKKLVMQSGNAVFNYKLTKLLNSKTDGDILTKHYSGFLETYKDPKVNTKNEPSDITVYIENNTNIVKIILKGESKKVPGRKDEFVFTK